MMQVSELTTAQLEKIPDAIQLDILAFDWWVHNADRTLTENGGNPNLFIEPSLRIWWFWTTTSHLIQNSRKTKFYSTMHLEIKKIGCLVIW
jgi:hypothetical protein